MGDSLDTLFVQPRLVLMAKKVDVYDAINLVIYAKLPLVIMHRGKELVAGFIWRDEAGALSGVMSQRQKDELLSKYGKEIDSFSYPVGPSQYEPLLERMVGANEYALPYFFHEHHHLVDRRRRAAMFAKLHGELAGLVSKGEVALQVADSERTHLMAAGSWMTAKTLSAYLDRHGVAPWWGDEENLRSHSRLERLLLSDWLNLSRSDSSEEYDRQQLPSFLFGRMCLKRTRVPFGFAQAGRSTSDSKPVEPQGSDEECENSHSKPRGRMERAESPAVPEAMSDKGISKATEIFPPASLHPLNSPVDVGSNNGKRELSGEHGFSEQAQEPSQESPATTLAPDEVMLTKREVAKFLGVSVNTVDNRRDDDPNFPEAVAYGSSLRWKRSEIEQWRDRKRVK